MIILSNCLTETVDEGCRKVANSFIRRIKRIYPDTTVVTYESGAGLGDMHLKLNKWMLSGKLAGLLKRKREPLLYIPAPAKALPAAIRMYVLSKAARWGLQVIQVMVFPPGKLAGWLMRHSRACVITLSRDAWRQYYDVIGDRAKYLKTGVDTEHFCPAEDIRKEELRKKYGLPADKPIVLHVGHLNAGRNIGQLLNLDEKWHTVLVVSTQTAAQQDAHLRQKLTERQNITLIDTYIPNIEELYQLADVYLFPVASNYRCIDVPLSALEAAACGIPVVTTAYGEMKELIGKEGFYEIDSFEPAALNTLLETAMAERASPRQSALEYDWNMAIKQIAVIDKEEKENAKPLKQEDPLC